MTADDSAAVARPPALNPRNDDGLSPEQRRRKDRIDLAQILALPDGPWDFVDVDRAIWLLTNGGL